MAGFNNDVVYGTNIDLSGAAAPQPTLVTNGQMLIASTALNAGGTHVNVGNIVSPLSTVTIGYSSPNITIDVNGSSVGQTITGNSGVISPIAGNWNILGTGSITTVGSGNTLTPQLTGLTNHAILIGAGTATITKVGPSATTGQVLQSQGASTDPAFSTATYPSTTTINQLLYSSSSNVVGGLSTVNSAILNTSASGVPSLATSPSCSGTLTAGTGLTATTGNVTISAGNLALPTTTSAASGVITIGGADFFSAYGTQNIFLGSFSGNFSLTGSANTGLGIGTLNSLTGGTQNTCMGVSAGGFITSSSGSVCAGYNTGLGITATGQNTLIGAYAGTATTGGNNTSVGFQSLYNYGNSGGASANNSIVGCYSGYRLYTGTDNSFFGYNSAPYVSSGSYNTAISDSSLPNLTTGSYNTTLGYNSGSGYTSSESSNICIGAAGTAAESNVLRIGTAGTGNGQVSTCYIAGISGVTVTGTAVLCSAAGQLGTIASSIRYKENIKPIDDDVSVMNLQVKSFNYKSDETKKTYYGLIAEEVHENFPYLCHYFENEPESVKYHELCTFLLVEIQRLNERLKRLEE